MPSGATCSRAPACRFHLPSITVSMGRALLAAGESLDHRNQGAENAGGDPHGETGQDQDEERLDQGAEARREVIDPLLVPVSQAPTWPQKVGGRIPELLKAAPSGSPAATRGIASHMAAWRTGLSEPWPARRRASRTGTPPRNSAARMRVRRSSAMWW